MNDLLTAFIPRITEHGEAGELRYHHDPRPFVRHAPPPLMPWQRAVINRLENMTLVSSPDVWIRYNKGRYKFDYGAEKLIRSLRQHKAD